MTPVGCPCPDRHEVAQGGAELVWRAVIAIADSTDLA